MTTIKSFTSLEQSKRLAEFLKGADMSWAGNGFGKPYARTIPCKGDPEEICPCWSLTALLEQMPCVLLESSRDNHYRIFWEDKFSEWHESAVDACVELLLRARKEEEK